MFDPLTVDISIRSNTLQVSYVIRLLLFK